MTFCGITMLTGIEQSPQARNCIRTTAMHGAQTWKATTQHGVIQLTFSLKNYHGYGAVVWRCRSASFRGSISSESKAENNKEDEDRTIMAKRHDRFFAKERQILREE